MNIAKLITEHNIRIDCQEKAVFVRHQAREVTCLCSATNGNKEAALECALIALVSLCRLPVEIPATNMPAKGLSTIRYGKSEPVAFRSDARAFHNNPIVGAVAP